MNSHTGKNKTPKPYVLPGFYYKYDFVSNLKVDWRNTTYQGNCYSIYFLIL